MRKVTHYDIGKIQHSCGSSHGESTTDLLAVSCSACLETMGDVLQNELQILSEQLKQNNLSFYHIQSDYQEQISRLTARLAAMEGFKGTSNKY